MKLASILLGAAVCLTSFATLSAWEIRTPGDPSNRASSKSSSKSKPKKEKKPRGVDRRGKRFKDFIMLGTGKDQSIILSNNVMYEPAHKHDANKTLDWQSGNVIRVLETSDKKRFILLNLNTGESMKAKILHWS